MPARKTTTPTEEAPAPAEETVAPAPETAEEQGAAAPCSNCGQPATQQTTNPGANVDYYCDSCADLIYPKPWPVKHLDTDPGDPLEPINAA